MSTIIVSVTVSQASQKDANTAATTDWKISYFYYDHLGNVTAVTDEHGNILEVMDYLPYGGRYIHEIYGDYQSDYTYNDKEKDDEVDLYYYGARYYNDASSQFSSIDPVSRFASSVAYLTDPQQWNSYSYTRNNPINFIDLFGLYNVATGLIEEGDTAKTIVDAVNKAFEITTNWETIADVSFFQDRFGTTDISSLVGAYTYVGSDYVANVTAPLNTLNKSRAEIAVELDFSPAELAVLFMPHGEWDLKNSDDPIFGSWEENGKLMRNFWAYVFKGVLIRYDAPGNINYGYVSRAIHMSEEAIRLGAAVEQFADDTKRLIGNILKKDWKKLKLPSFGDKGGDWKYIKQGYDLYIQDNKKRP